MATKIAGSCQKSTNVRVTTATSVTELALTREHFQLTILREGGAQREPE